MNARAAVSTIAIALILSGCVRPLSACDLSTATSPIDVVQCQAARGDKLAQLRLGIAYEDGAGVEQDYARAARLYRQAATPTPGTTYVYSPPVGRESSGRVIPIRTGTDQAGLPEAKFRLARLLVDGRGLRRDRDRAIEFLEDAAEAGNADAQALLASLERRE